MASNSRAEELKTSMDQRFTEIDEVKNGLVTRLETINTERDNLLNTTMMQEVSDAYLAEHFAGYAAFIAGGGTKEDFIKGKDADGRYNISMDQKLAIIAEHKNTSQIYTGADKFSADLSDSQKIKAERKKRYKEDADNLLADYRKILDENERLIGTLEQDIATKKNKIAEAETALTELIKTGSGEFRVQGVGGSSTQTKTNDDVMKQVEMLKKNISTWKSEVRKQEKELEQVRELHNKYVAEFAKRKNEIVTLLEKGKIFSGAEQQGTNDAQEKTENANGATSLTTTKTIDAPKQLAKSMLEDFYTRTPDQQKTILAQCGSKDILNAARHLGVVERRKLARVLESRVDELDGNLSFTGKNGVTVNVTKAQLMKGAAKDGLTEDQLKVISEEISEFNKNFQSKSLDEIKAFEDKIQYVRYACYMQETGWFRNITKHFDFLNKRNFKINELSKTLAHYATIKNERERNQVAQLNKWRKTLKLNPVNDLAITNPRELDRTGQDPIFRQDYHQDR